MNNRRLLLVYAIVLVDIAVGSIVWPILPELVKETDLPALWLSIGTGLFLGIQIFTAPLLGKLSDLKGRKPIFILSAIGTTLANTLLLPVRAWAYLANRGSDGLTNGVYATVRSSIADLSTPETLVRNMGIEGSIVSIGFVIGPLISGALLFSLDLDGPAATLPLIWLGIGLSCINILLAIVFKETHQPTPTEEALPLKTIFKEQLKFKTSLSTFLRWRVEQPQLFRLLLWQFFMVMGLGYYHYFIIYISLGELQMTPQDISLFFIYMGAISIFIGYYFFTRLADRIQAERWIRGLAVIGAVLHVAYTFVGASQLWLYVLITIDCFTIGILPGIMDGLLGKETQATNRGEIFGISQLLMGLANMATTLVFSGLSLISLEWPFYWFALCLVPLFWVRASDRVG